MAKAKKQKPLDEEGLTRNLEMAEGKGPEEAAKIYKKGDKYYCAECHSQLPLEQDCPTCHAHIDWARLEVEMRR
jgi:hypothetical protein